MQLIDTHSHLHFEHFKSDLKEVLQRACETGVKYIVTLGTDVESSKDTIHLCEEYPDFLLGAVGIHPTDCLQTTSKEIEHIEKLARHPSIVAIGEIGLDLYWKEVPLEKQWEIFLSMKEIAERKDLPMVIHTREAYDEMVRFFKENPFKREVPGVMHSFDGDIQHAKFFIDQGFYISFTGVVTFKNYRKQELLKYIPADRLVIETDAPFLAPHPYRGKRNEPAFLQYTLQKIAEIKGLPLYELSQEIFSNSLKLFNIEEKYSENKHKIC